MMNKTSGAVERPFQRKLETHYFLNDKPQGVNEEGIKTILHNLSRTKRKLLVVRMNARKESEGISKTDLPGLITEHMVELVRICRFKVIDIRFLNNPIEWVKAPDVPNTKTREDDFGFGVADEHEDVPRATPPPEGRRPVPRQPPESPQN